MKENNNIIIKIMYFLCILPFLGIYGIKNNINSIIYESWQIISMLFLFFRIIKISKIKVNFFILFFIFFEIEIFITTTFKMGFSFGILNITLVTIFLILLIQYDFDLIINTLHILFFVILLANTISMFVIENTETAMYFVGGKNSFSMYFVPSIFIVMFYSYYKFNHLNKISVLYIVVSLFEIFLGESGTGIVVATIALFLILFLNKMPKNKYIYIGVICFIYIVLILGTKILYSNNLWIMFTNLLGKDSTLTSRAVIWNNVINQLKNNIIFGLGRGYPIFYTNSFNIKNVVYETHNFFLEILSQGGLIGSFFYFMSFINVLKGINMNKKLEKILFVSIIVLLINGFTESINNNMIVILTIAITNRVTKNLIIDKENIHCG